MELFGTSGGDGSKENRDPLFGDIGRDLTRPANDAQTNFVAGGIVVVAVVAFFGKFIPLCLMGLLMGIVLYHARFQFRPADRARVYAGALGFFALACFLLVGSPLEKRGGDFMGLLFPSPTFRGWLVQAMREWNNLFPSGKFFHRFWITQITASQVTLYFWGAALAGIAFSGLFLGVAAWRKSEAKSTAFKRAVARAPSRVFAFVTAPVLKTWMKQGYRISSGSLGHGITHTFMLAAAGGVAARFGAPFIPYLDIRSIAQVMAFFPAADAAFGFWLGRQDFGKDVYRALAGGEPPRPDPKPGNGELFLLGYTTHGYPFELTERNLAYHVEVLAPSGAGKTNTLKNLLSDRIRRGHGVVFLDLKGEFDVAAWMYRAAKSVGREGEIRLLSLANRELSVPYNPIKHGTAAEIHSQLMSSLTWSEEYYRKIGSVALMTLLRGLCEYRDKTGSRFHLGHIYELLDRPGVLRAFNERLVELKLPASRDVERLAEKLDRTQEREKLTGLVAGLNTLIYSAAGPLMTEDSQRGSYDFREAIDQGRITYCLMNSLLLKESASVFGKMILQDLMSFVGHRYAGIERDEPHRPVTLIIDEFANFATPEFIDFMDRARGAGIGIVMAHQARADLRKISPEFQERVEANANTAIVSGIKSSQDAEYYAGMVGTRTVEKETRQVNRGFLWDNETGVKSVREVEEYVVHPNELKRLDQGEAFAISRTVDPHWALIRIPQANEFREFAVSSAELKQHFVSVRDRYLNGTGEKYLELPAPAPRKTAPKVAPTPTPAPAQQEQAGDAPKIQVPETTRAQEPELWS